MRNDRHKCLKMKCSQAGTWVRRDAEHERNLPALLEVPALPHTETPNSLPSGAKMPKI